ncbi:MAG: M28 family peptidase [Phycisphaeraceae bacterium]|nr:M28 family peptidase [Phycisphaeraceae bacterium]
MIACHLAACLTLLAGPDPAAVPAMVSQERLLETIKALPVKRAGWRDDENREGLVKTEALLQDRLKALGYEPTLHEIGAFEGRGEPGSSPVWHNIVVDIPGQTKPKEIIIVGAHFDAVPIAPGADDNGTGVAAVLELARVLKDVPMQRTVRLCLFNLEEVQPLGIGLVGSGRYAADLAPEIKAGTIKVVGMLSLDMLGYFNDEPNSQKWPALPVSVDLPTTADFIAVGGIIQHRGFSQPLIKAMRRGGPGVKVFAGDILPLAVPDFMRSDHASFLAMGIPAVIVSDTANFRSKHYHGPTDTIETIDAKRFTEVVKGLAAGVIAVARPVRAPADSAPDQIDPRPRSGEPEAAAPGPMGKPPGQVPERPR